MLEILSSWSPNNQIPLKKLAYKLVTLLGLITAHRLQTFSLININNILILDDRLEIKITANIKTSGPNRKQPLLILPFYPKTEIFPARTLMEYIDRTKKLRGEITKLFISFKKP